MKHYVLVAVIEPPRTEAAQLQGYRALLADKLHISNLPDPENRKLAANVWLLERDSEVSTLAKIVSEAEAYGVQFQVKFLAGE
jgi:hypothetical protein